ncbi:MAG: TadE/TadG family protein [Alphaproteobacteria bacterium]|nr:MAG: TadE/TadG family protein [Alphaproteobacteria bacterium]
MPARVSNVSWLSMAGPTTAAPCRLSAELDWVGARLWRALGKREKAMFRSLNTFIRNSRGAFAMQFALLAVPLTVCTGLAVDGGRAFLARFELASALDAAALAVGSTLQQGTDLNAVAAKFVEKNFRTEHSDPIVLTLTTVDDTIVLRGTVKINTFFMPIVGQPTVTINAESEVRRGGSNVEVALALDITGSMNATRLAGLKSAANVLISEVVNDVQTPFFSRVAIVPWSQAINLDLPGGNATGLVPAAALDQLRGPLIGPRNVSDAVWRVTGTPNISVAEAGWRTTAGARSISSSGNSGVDWRWGASVNISSLAKVTVGTGSSQTNRIRVTTSSDHGYSNGQFVRITGAGGSYTALNNRVFRVGYNTSSPDSNTVRTYYLREADDSAWVPQPSGSTSSSAASQRCYDSACNIGVKTTAAFTGLAAGDFVNITGTSGFNAINNSNTTTWQVAEVVSGVNAFTISNWNGPSQGSMSAGGGTVSECLVSDCRYRVTTGTLAVPVNHGFTTTDNVAIWNMTESGSGTSAMNAINTSWKVSSPSGSVFYLPGNGKNYRDWASGGMTAECQLATCNARVTVVDSGLNVGDTLELAGVSGLTGLNNNTSKPLWRIVDRDVNVLTLRDTGPSLGNMTNDYTTGGTSQCLAYGCARFAYTLSGSTRVWSASPCIVERYGDDRYTDVSPETARLGINYTANGTCTRTNYVTPLTANKTQLTAQINALSTGGNTAGQLGIAWAWYLLSPNFADIWTAAPENVPQAYGARDSAKVAILMTDGEFNAQTCDGLFSSSDCTPDNPTTVPGPSASFRQARMFCDAMRARNIIVYTVGLELNNAQFSDDFLLACATSPQNAFLASNTEELEQAFKDIAVSINRLRLSR